MTRSIKINAAFNGPPNCGQGGYVSGTLAKQTNASVCEASLKLPTPLGKPLSVEADDETINLISNGKTLVSVTQGSLELDIPACPSHSKTKAASENYRGHKSKAIFDTCFVCGNARDDHAAMRIFPGSVENAETEGLHAAHWTPNSVHCDEDGTVEPEFLWSALDCPGYFAGCADGQMALLGRMTTSITGTLRVGEPSTIIGWPISSAGRKVLTGTAIYNADKQCIASAEGLWIHIDKNPFAV